MDWLDDVENFLIMIVSRLAPWAAPLAPAYLVARSIQVHFKTPDVIGWAVGVALEAIGVATAHITLEMHNYNSDPARVKADPIAPFWLGIATCSVYFLSGFVLTVLLEIWPDSVKVAPALFFILAGVAYVTLALMSGHSRRLKQVADAKEERRRASREPAQISIMPGPMPITCRECGREFEKVQGLNAHKRFCAGVNGREPVKEEQEANA